MLVPATLAGFGWRTVGVIALEPLIHIEDVDLLAPKQARQRLALDHLRFSRSLCGLNAVVKLVGIGLPGRDNGIDLRERPIEVFGSQPQPKYRRLPAADSQLVNHTGLGTGLVGIDLVVL